MRKLGRFTDLFKTNFQPYSKPGIFRSRERSWPYPQTSSGIDSTICPLHRESLGLGWRRGSAAWCGVPEASSNPIMTEDAKTGRNAIEESGKLILKKTGVFLQVGSGKFAFFKLGLTLLTSLRFLKKIDSKPLTLIFLGICASCRKTLRLLTAEEKESTVIAISTPRSIDASVLMQMENFNQVSFDPR